MVIIRTRKKAEIKRLPAGKCTKEVLPQKRRLNVKRNSGTGFDYVGLPQAGEFAKGYPTDGFDRIPKINSKFVAIEPFGYLY
jgi:hypothetical protein